MKSIFKFGAPALVLFAAMPASAGTVTACIAQAEDRNGVLSFLDYAVARSDVTDAGRDALQAAAEGELRAHNREPGRVVCQSHSGVCHYVVVAGGVELNSQLRHMIGFGYGTNREEALSQSDNRLNNTIEYNIFRRNGGELTVIEEGPIGG